MNVPGLAGCYMETGGLFYFARMCSKIRLHAEGKLPEAYWELLGQGFDGRTCRYLEVTYAQLREQVQAGKSDAEALAWCYAHGRELNAEQILFFNSFMSKRGWRDDETDVFIPQMIREYGLPHDGRIQTDFDVIEMDEGRWHTDQWRKAWH